jgi:hypothetical protein
VTTTVAEQCRPVRITVDGEDVIVRVRGSEPLTEQGQAVLAEIVAVVRRKYREQHPEGEDDVDA